MAQEIRRPTADSQPALPNCPDALNSTFPSPAMANAYDVSGTATSSSLTASSAGFGDTDGSFRQFTNWAAPSAAYSSLTLSINFSCADTSFSGKCQLQYTTNGTTPFTTIFSSAFGQQVAQQTQTVTLPSNQDFTKLIVGVCAEDTGISANETLTIFDIWTSGVLPPGNPHRIIWSKAKKRHRHHHGNSKPMIAASGRQPTRWSHAAVNFSSVRRTEDLSCPQHRKQKPRHFLPGSENNRSCPVTSSTATRTGTAADRMRPRSGPHWCTAG